MSELLTIWAHEQAKKQFPEAAIIETRCGNDGVAKTKVWPEPKDPQKP
jgi:hypothetical protein